MQKNELLLLAQNMCKELTTIIDTEENASKEQLANYLYESAELIMNITDKDISTTDFAETLFHNAYKEIAQKSLSSYEKTNSNINRLTQMHKETLEECHSESINLSEIIEKFNDIQTFMANEVQKANQIILQLSDQVKVLEKNSNLDSLTKVFNRRALSTYLKELCAKETLPHDLRFLILDIDDFKTINDTHGHLAGDKILIFIANIFRKTLRDGDKVFRYGGEEFVIILNRLNDTQCTKISQRLLELVRENTLVFKGASLKVTMSIGTTKFAQGDTPDSLISRADKALYKAKNKGKDQMYSEVIDGV